MPFIWCALTKRPCYLFFSENLDKDESERLRWLRKVRIVRKNGDISEVIDYDGYTTIRVENNEVRLIDPSISFNEDHDGILLIDKVYQMIIDNPNFNSQRNLYELLKNFCWRSDIGLIDDFCPDIGHSDLLVCPPEERERYTFSNILTPVDECYYELVDPELCIENTEDLRMIVEEFVIFSNR